MDNEILKNLKIDIENFYFKLNMENNKEMQIQLQKEKNKIQKNNTELNSNKNNNTLLKTLKKDIETFTNNCSIFKFTQFKNDMINKYNKQIEEDIINFLCIINKYDITQQEVYDMIISLKKETISFYNNLNSSIIKNKNTYINKQKREWLILYGDLYMKSDTLYNGLVNKTIDYSILDKILSNMKEVIEGNKTKMNSDIEIGKILFNKYVSK